MGAVYSAVPAGWQSWRVPGVPNSIRHGTIRQALRLLEEAQSKEGLKMHGIIYLVGLVVVVLAILSLFGLR